MNIKVLASGSTGNCSERWADIPGWEGLYQISDHGRLKSFKKDRTGRILSNKNATGWYLNVVLCAPGRKNYSVKLHQLVAEAFIPNPSNKPEVNHKDFNKQNNHHTNLEWATRMENGDHARQGKPTSILGMIRYNTLIRPKTIVQLTLSGREVGRFNNAQDAARATGICQRNILQVAGRTEYKPGKTRKQAGGFVWKFAEGGGSHGVPSNRQFLKGQQLCFARSE